MHIHIHLTMALWIGTVWPFIIMLPILMKGYVKPSGKTALKVLIPLIAAFGWSPLVFCRIQHLEWSTIGSSVLVFTFLLLPLGVLLPFMLVLVHSTTTSLSIGIVIGALLLVLVVFLIVSSRHILTFRKYL
ncbi:hypothetical protein KP509_07G053000 [Ceratopteris richardii]|uniref:Uncharacterized protein n=1 Tax=Ceratopteris richardii TaxID=49495 RepID=A0A8T2UEH3_CERRI|nr:hypothetical protein KP509_07G053000 [Ceratopteris richardii]